MNEEAATKMVEAAGGAPELQGRRLLGVAMDNELLAIASYDGPQRSTYVHVTDTEYHQVRREAFFPRDWLEKAYASSRRLPSSVRDAMRAVFTKPDAPTPELLSAEEDPNHSALRKEPDPDTIVLLKAGGHMYWTFVGDGPVASVHKKGLRFVGDKGKRKTRNVKSTIAFGSMAPRAMQNGQLGRSRVVVFCEP